MPLSEHEQRMLEQMERALYAEDPKFASALEGSGLRTYTRRRVYQAVAGFLVGIAGFLLAVRSEVQLKAERAWMRATLTQLRLTIPAAEPRTRKALDDMLEKIEHRK